MSDSSISLLRHPPFQLYLGGRALAAFASQMVAVIVAWQLYALTDSAFLLGMIGLVQFIPTALLIFIAGHAADRYDRKRVMQLCQFGEAVGAAFLAWGSIGGWLTVEEMFAVVLVFGIGTAFSSPASGALMTGVSPEGLRQKATALATGTFEAATIAGPALGGLAYGISPGVAYIAIAVLWLLGGLLMGAIRLERPVAAERPAPTPGAIFAGWTFVRRNPAILGAAGRRRDDRNRAAVDEAVPAAARARPARIGGAPLFVNKIKACAEPRGIVGGWRQPPTSGRVAPAFLA